MRDEGKSPVEMKLAKRDWGTLICLALVAAFMLLVWIFKKLQVL